jgi:chaperonin GroES
MIDMLPEEEIIEVGPYDDEDVVDALPTGMDRLNAFAEAEGDISELLTEDELTQLGADAVQQWQEDDTSREEWKNLVKDALDAAAQFIGSAKDTPWPNAANVKYPILTTAAQQFAARAYPAVVKGDEAVGVKVLGMKPKQPQIPPQAMQQDPRAQQAMQAFQQAQAAYEGKEARAQRVKTFLNYLLFYVMDDWEGDVDVLLNQYPITGMGFKKVYRDPIKGTTSEYVNALNLTVHNDTKSLERCPRVTQDFERYPYEIAERIASGLYRDAKLFTGTEIDEQKPRQLIEQHRLQDLDGDGIAEPYVVTVDVESQKVLRVEAAFTPADVIVRGESVLTIRRWMPYVAFPFMPDPKGRFYAIGFGQLLAPLSAVINTLFNQMLDAGHAQNAGGGFIGSGLRLQGNGQNNVIRMKPGEYKNVNATGQDLRAMIWERTLPPVSAVQYQLLELVLGAAKDISAVKDVLTGEANSNAPVGTTLALIEQGLQQFTAIYKRYYRSQRKEFQLIYECEARYGGEDAAAKYQEVLDDPNADFAADFAEMGDDIVPVSDPTVVTRAQQMAKADLIVKVAGALPGVVNMPEAATRIFEGAQIDNPEQLIVQPQPNPMAEAGAQAEIDKNKSEAEKNRAQALKAVADAGATAGEAGDDADTRRVPDMAGPPGNGMGPQGMPGPGGDVPPSLDGGDLSGGVGLEDPGQPGGLGPALGGAPV